MSRRKQAKPRALKRSDWEEMSPVDSDLSIPEVQESTSNVDMKDSKIKGDAVGSGLLTNGLTGSGDETATDSPTNNVQIYRCASCGLSLTSLKKFMDHRNFDCIAGAEESRIIVAGNGGGGPTIQSRNESGPEEGHFTIEMENSLGSDVTTSGVDPSDADNPSTTHSPSTCSLTPTETDLIEQPTTVIDVGQMDGQGQGQGHGHQQHQHQYTLGVTEATPYACQFCDKAFPRLSYLKRHEQGHGDLMPFKCDFCHRLFKHKRSRDRHVKLHTGDKKYRCSHCDSAFSRSDHLKIHMKTHDTAKPFQCSICNRGYNTAAALTSHMQNHKKASITKSACFRCLQCTAHFQTSVQLKDHLLTHSSRSSSPMPDRSEAIHQCPICVKDFTTLDMLYQHMKTHTDVAVVVGEMDQSSNQESTSNLSTKEVFQSMDSLHGNLITNGDKSPASKTSTRHRITLPPSPPSASPTIPNNYNNNNSKCHQLCCEYCTMQFTSIQALQKHTLSVHSFNDLMATSSSKLPTGNGNNFPRHSESPVDGCNTAVCQHCTMGFKNGAALTEHVKLVHGDFLSSLNPESEKSKSNNSAIRSPNQVQSSPNGNLDPVGHKLNGDFAHPGTLLCNQCNAAFPDFEAFRTHLKTHLDEVVEKHVCGECAGEFGSSDELERHAAGHYLATSTEYGCQSCLKLFVKPDELQKHLMDIHAHHLYRCSLCHKVFDSKVSVQVHFAVKHSNECKLYKCTGCSSVFRSEFEFNVHVKVAHVRRAQPFRCLFCQFSYDSELELQCHLTTHKKQFKCRLCDDAFHVEFLLDRHVQSKHSTSVVTTIATANTNVTVTAVPSSMSPTVIGDDNQSVQRQRNPSNVDSVTNINCKSTGSGCKSMKGKSTSGIAVAPVSSANLETSTSEVCLNSHRLQVHHQRCSTTGSSTSTMNNTTTSISNKPSTTTTATTMATTTSTMLTTSVNQQHILSLHCAYCNESCKSRTELEQHVTRSHRNVNCSGKHKCNICDELCPTATLLAEHKLTTHCKVTTGSTCVLCKSNLKTEDQFYSHLQLHGGESTTISTSSNPTSTNTKSMCDGNANPTGSGSGSGSTSGTSVLPVPCVVCRQTLMTEIEVQMHGKFHLRNVADPLHPCCICLKMYEPINLIENTVGEQSFICKECFHRGVGVKSPSSSPILMDRLRCPECRVKFETSPELESHLRSTSNASENTVSCVNHSTSIVKSRGGPISTQYQCIKCQASFNSEAEIQVHVATHVLHEGTCHVCNLCSCTFATPKALQCHLLEHNFARVDGAGARVDLSARGDGYACYMCSAVFTCSKYLQSHMLEHGLESRPFNCHICHQRFFFLAELENHAFTHVNVNGTPSTDRLVGSPTSAKCPHCPDLDFITSTDMQRHYFDVHSDQLGSTSIDKSSSSDVDSFGVRHQRSVKRHSGCLDCPGGVGSSKNFEMALIHQRHRDHQLESLSPGISKRFQNSSLSNDQASTSSNIKPYECPGCRRRFARNDNLRAHIQKSRCGGRLNQQISRKITSGLRNTRSSTAAAATINNNRRSSSTAVNSRTCGICSTVTMSTRALRRHMRDTHNRKYEFICSLCNDPFSTTESLERHLKRTHSVSNGVVSTDATKIKVTDDDHISSDPPTPEIDQMDEEDECSEQSINSRPTSAVNNVHESSPEITIKSELVVTSD